MRLVSVFAMTISALVMPAAAAEAECFGEAGYQICVSSYTDANGDLHVDSYDSSGNTYSLDTESHISSDGDLNVRSYDSEGNEYSIKSWSDGAGSHSMDSEGNSCSILNDGTTIGCD